MFIFALQDLKYMGYMSATRKNAFLFRKNFFNKPNGLADNYSSVVENDVKPSSKKV